MSSDTPVPSSDPSSHEEPSRTKKIVWGVVAIAVALGLGLIVHSRIAQHRGGFQPRGGFGNFGAPLAVGVANVTQGDVPITIDSLGTVTPLATVTVHPMVTGPLVSIPFQEGQMVKSGQLLAQIDPRPFQAAVDQTMGQLEHDQALLANARVDLERYRTLMAQNSVAEQTFATQQATVLQDQATVVSDKAALETAKLNLSYTHVVAPVGGSVGLRQVDNGNVVSAYSSTICVVTQLQPMSVLFTVPEDDLTEVLRRLRTGEKLQAIAYDRTFTTKLDTGVLSNSDNEVDTTTGTLKLRAMFNNSAMELFPSQFVNIRLTLDTLHDQLLIPGVAVQNGASGSYVYVVDQQTSGPPPGFVADPPAGSTDAAPSQRHRRGGAAAFGGGAAAAGPVRVVHVRYVTVGPTVGDMISIRNGLQLGETVVVDGAEQLRDGARVTVPQMAAEAPDATAPGATAPGATASGTTASERAGTGSPARGAAAGADAAHRFRGAHRGHRPGAATANGSAAPATAATP